MRTHTKKNSIKAIKHSVHNFNIKISELVVSSNFLPEEIRPHPTHTAEALLCQLETAWLEN